VVRGDGGGDGDGAVAVVTSRIKLGFEVVGEG
jgi:hypothetical protein